MSAPVTVYSTSWCGPCTRLKRELDGHGVRYVEVDISDDPAAAEFVMAVNNGMQRVPTVLFPDGSTLYNPSAAAVVERIEQSA